MTQYEFIASTVILLDSRVSVQWEFDDTTAGCESMLRLLRKRRGATGDADIAIPACLRICHVLTRKIVRSGLNLRLADLGRGPVVGDPDENGKFKVMPVRNGGLSTPYAHNGLFRSLKEIVHSYNTGDVPGANPGAGTGRRPSIRPR